MGQRIYLTRCYMQQTLFKFPEICFTETIMCLPFMYCTQFKFFREQRRKIFWPTHFGEPLRLSFATFISILELVLEMLCRKPRVSLESNCLWAFGLIHRRLGQALFIAICQLYLTRSIVFWYVCSSFLTSKLLDRLTI